MSTYAIGDIQGCFHSFQNLLDKISFNPHHDKLWLVGDIINRGAGSLQVLRWVYQHRDAVVLVLGNHDLHTLVVAEGFVAAHRSDTLQELLIAPDKAELLGWLRNQKMIHYENGFLMVHAGLLPQWGVDLALSLGAEVERALRGSDYLKFLKHMYGNLPDAWEPDLEGWDRLRLITNVMTRLRVCSPQGQMEFKFKGRPENIPQGLVSWFDAPGRKSAQDAIIFGHWSALGLLERDNLFALDTGCLWGGELTALRLDDRAVFQVPCDPADAPKEISFSD